MTISGELSSRFKGTLIDSGHPEYDAARRVWNGMIDKRPALIARCADEADVKAVIAHARSEKLPVAVRGGAHNVAGFATVDGGVVVDVSRMKNVEVDAGKRVAVAGAGLTWGEF